MSRPRAEVERGPADRSLPPTRTDRSKRPRAVVLRALGLGDLLTAVPALRGLRRGLPGHDLVLAAPAWLGPLVAAIGAVDLHEPVGEMQPLPASLMDPDVAVNLHGSGPQSHRLLLDIGPQQLIAFHHREVAGTRAAPAWDDDEHEVVRWCRLVRSAGMPADPEDLDLAVPSVPPPAAALGATVVHPGAKSGSRRWPAERFAAVARAERARGRAVVVTGSAAERGRCGEVAARAGLHRDAVLAGTMDLARLAATVAAAGRVVCGDTGMAHLATALGTPSVVIFGPTPPAAWGPPASRRGRHRVLWAGRSGDPLGEEPFDGLLDIGVEDVVAELAQLDDDGPDRSDRPPCHAR